MAPSPVVTAVSPPRRGCLAATPGQTQSETRSSMGAVGQVIVMVGLPARGKTYIAKKMTRCEDGWEIISLLVSHSVPDDACICSPCQLHLLSWHLCSKNLSAT
jgi:hypothetical protein